MLKKLFPPDLVDYIPGQKLIAGVVVAIGMGIIGWLANLGVDTSVVGIDAGVVAVFASLLAVYLWPETEAAEVESELASVDEPLGIDPGS